MAQLIQGFLSVTKETPSGDYSGTFVDGNSVVISGTGFGTKIPAAPELYASYKTSLTPEIGTWTIFNSEFAWGASAVDGVDCCWIDLSTDLDGVEQSEMGLYNLDGENLYTHVQRHYEWAGNAAYNMKVWRMWRDIDQVLALGQLSDIFYGWPQTNNDPTVTQENHVDIGYETTDGIPLLNSWTQDEYLLQHNSAVDVADGILKIMRKNVQIGVPIGGFVNHPDDEWIFKSTALPQPYREIFIQDDISDPNRLPAGYLVGYRDAYIDTTWKRVMVGDNAVFASCTEFAIQIPTAWSDTSITIDVNQSLLASFANKYCFVIGADNAVIQSFKI